MSPHGSAGCRRRRVSSCSIRTAFALFLTLASLPILAQDEWSDLLARAGRDRKPIVVLFRTEPCERCDDFESVTLAHPMIHRRLPEVAFAILPAPAGEDASIAFFDRTGRMRARWGWVPDTTDFGIVLDSIVAVAPEFECAVQLTEAGAPGEGELEAAIGFTRLRRLSDARASLAVALEQGSEETRQKATILAAILDANDGRRDAIPRLKAVAATGATPQIAADARTVIGALERGTASVATASAVRILPPGRQVVSGMQIVKTRVTSADVAEVTFQLDGREVRRSRRPPFSARLDFGTVPERHVVRVTARDGRGRVIGEDERVLNDAGEAFWIRLVSPRAGAVSGEIPVECDVRVPAGHRVRNVVLSWNGAERATLTAPPWNPAVTIPPGQAGILRVVAELTDGRTSEDAVLLNAGPGEEATVQLVQLPITILHAGESVPQVSADRIVVREGERVRPVEAVATAEETPLTVGLLIDVSDSMQKTLPDVQEAAIRFLQSVLGDRDRAFLITFDSAAHLLQPATSEVSLLSRQIMRVRPNGLTALHDAMALGLLQFEGTSGRRALVVFSDGIDRTSHHRAADVRELARRMGVPIHVIESTPVEENDGSLAGVAKATGGTAQRVEQLADLPDVFARIEAALRAQVLAFIRVEAAVRENDWRPVRVEIAGDALEILAPAGYSPMP